MRKKYKQLTVNSLQLTDNGQSLIEVVVAIAIAAILAVSILSTMLVTQKTTNSAKNNSEATKLAQETVEQMRVYRDIKGFDTLSSNLQACRINTSDTNPNNWSLVTNAASCPDTIPSTDPDNGSTLFYRRINISNINSEDGSFLDGKVLVTVTITWEESGGEQSVVSKTYLSKWEGF